MMGIEFNINPAMIGWLKFVIILVFLDVLLGMALAVKNKDFSWRRLPSFLNSEIKAYVLGILVLVVVSLFDDTGFFVNFALIALGFYTLKMWAEVWGKLKQFGFVAGDPPPLPMGGGQDPGVTPPHLKTHRHQDR